MRLGKHISDNVALVLAVDALGFYMWRHGYTSTKAFAALVVMTISGGYGWLLATHPDQAATLRRALWRPLAAAGVRVVALTKHAHSRLPKSAVEPVTYAEAVNDTKASIADLKQNARSLPAATRQWNELFDGWAKQPIGQVVDYEYDEATGNKRWIVALPPPLTADGFAGACKDGIVNKLGTSSEFVQINPRRRSDGVLQDGVADVFVEHQLSRRDIETGAWPHTASFANTFSVLNGVHIGRTKDSELWLPLYQTHIFASGVTRWGKSAFLRLIVAAVARMKDAELWIIDPKDVDYTLWEPFAARYETDNAKFGKMLDDLLAVMQQRLSSMRGVSTQWKPTPDAKQIVLVIDEAADVPKDVQEEKLVKLIQKGSGAGITILAATVRITGDQVNTTFRSQFITRVAFKTEDDNELRIILGKQLPAGITHKRITRKGDCWVKTPEHGIQLARTYYMSDEEMVDYTRRLSGIPTPGNDPGTAENPDIPGNETSPMEGFEGEAENAVSIFIPPPELFGEVDRTIAVYRVLIEANEPLSKAEIARRVGQAEVGKPFDKGTLRINFDRLEELGLMRVPRPGSSHMSGWIAVSPSDKRYPA